jgi:hypothetical protein
MQNCPTSGAGSPPDGPRSTEDIPAAPGARAFDNSPAAAELVSWTPAQLFVALASGANHVRNALTLLELGYKSGGDQATNDALIRVLTRRLWQAVFTLEAPAATTPRRPAPVPDDAAETRQLVVSRFMARGEQLESEPPRGPFSGVVELPGNFARPLGAAVPRADGAA